MNPTNEERAEVAAHGLDAYGIAREGRDDYDDPVDMAADLICDLMHLIRGHGGNPFKEIDTAKTNFEAEEQEALPRRRPSEMTLRACRDLLIRIDPDGKDIWNAFKPAQGQRQALNVSLREYGDEQIDGIVYTADEEKAA